MYRRSTVPFGSKHVPSFHHAASGAAEKQFSIFTFNCFLGSFLFFQTGSFHA
jgi:hypothetical protein